MFRQTINIIAGNGRKPGGFIIVQFGTKKYLWLRFGLTKSSHFFSILFPQSKLQNQSNIDIIFIKTNPFSIKN